MSVRHIEQELLARAEIVAPPSAQGCRDQSFELPPALYLATAVLFLGFVGVLSMAFASLKMAIVFSVCAAFMAAFFTIPAIFVRAGAEQCRSRSLTWSQFMENGVAIEHGRCSGRDAAVLMLLLPALIFCFGVAVAVIAAFV